MVHWQIWGQREINVWSHTKYYYSLVSSVTVHYCEWVTTCTREDWETLEEGYLNPLLSLSTFSWWNKVSEIFHTTNLASTHCVPLYNFLCCAVRLSFAYSHRTTHNNNNRLFGDMLVLPWPRLSVETCSRPLPTALKLLNETPFSPQPHLRACMTFEVMGSLERGV